MTRYFRPICHVLLAFLALLLFGSLAITLDGLQDNLQHADMAVIPGSRVEPDGSPSPMLQARLDRAVELYRQGYFKLVLVSGGQGKEGYDEAAIMGSYLQSKGIQPDAIMEDHKGDTTWMTAKNTIQMICDRRAHGDRSIQSVMIISQYFHVPRIRLSF